MPPAGARELPQHRATSLADVLWALPSDVLEANLWAQLSARDVHAFKLAFRDAHAACCETRPRVTLHAENLGKLKPQKQVVLAALHRRRGLREVCVDVSGRHLGGRWHGGVDLEGVPGLPGALAAMETVVPLLYACRDAASFAQRVEACSARFDVAQPDPWTQGSRDGKDYEWYRDRCIDLYYAEHEVRWDVHLEVGTGCMRETGITAVIREHPTLGLRVHATTHQ